MMRSLYSAVAGLRAHQTRMDVIGNNIANVNTVGFKSSSVTFRDVLYQTIKNPTTPSDQSPIQGGTNPSQIGIGSKIASINVLNTRAGAQTTDRPMDCYIDGEGYFKVQSGEAPNIVEYYTRVGDFNIDSLGRLVDGMGNFVMGINATDGVLDQDPDPTTGAYQAGVDDEVINLNGTDSVDGAYTQGHYSQISIGNDGLISAYDSTAGGIVTLGRIAVYKFPNNDGLSQAGNTYLQVTANSGDPTMAVPGLVGTGKVQTDGLEMSNVELAKEFTDMIITERGFQANSRVITTSDEMLQELVNLKR
ncbi:MAG: flagellar hook-basal body complex protein [Oscillospiraceae bacterium]|nr:flagellar hook-basal body complex protein [Oscillospiraceae bacterium]